MGSIPKALPTIVLVHGAWHGPRCWDLLVPQLKQRNFPTEAIKLPSAGLDPEATVASDAAHIQKTTSRLAAEGKDIVLVMHSYGGIPGTESAKGLLKKLQPGSQKVGGIVSLIYVTAFLLEPGSSLHSVLGGYTPPWMHYDGNKSTVSEAQEVFYHDVAQSEMDRLVSELVYHSKASFDTPLTYPAYKEVPVSYVLCEEDRGLLLPTQQAMAATGGPGVVTYTLPASHSPMLSMPDKLAEIIQGSVERLDG